MVTDILEQIDSFIFEGALEKAEALCHEELQRTDATGIRIVLLHRLLEILHRRERLPEATSVCRDVLQLMENIFGFGHIYIAGVLHNLALLLNEQGAYEEAIVTSQREIAILSVGLPPEQANSDERMAEAKLTMSKHLYEQGHFAKAEALLQEILPVLEATQGRESLGVSACLNNFGRIRELSGENEKSIPFFTEAVAIRKKLLGQHPDTAFIMLNLGTALAGIGRFIEAIPVLEDCGAMYVTLGLAESRYAKACRANLALSRQKAGQSL